ncbi:MAG: diacylglycerol kinase family lipid kinase [Candidatus Margulisbacteria bacterium]|nr:diacylglycerol kinase family lipid kinase [Candidatus Margulisiibacteriota bacterium]
MARTYFIVNPRSASGQTAKRWPAIKQAFEAALGPLDFALTEGPGHATRLALLAQAQGFETIVAVGGDGTLHEVLNGISEQAVLGYYPSGTGQDFSQTMGIAGQTMADHVKRLLKGEQKRIDVGLVTYRSPAGGETARKFINVSSLGFSAHVVQRVNRSSKRLGGKMTFLLGVLRSLLLLKNHQLRIEVDGAEFFNGRSLIVTMANGRFFGGSMMIAPGAEVDDGLFEVVVVAEMGRLEVLLNIGSIYAGRHLTHPKIKLVRGREITVSSPETAWIEADGELLGVTEAKFQLLRQAVAFIV